MTERIAADWPPGRQPDIDENGVDLAQIRAMLDRKPGERLSLMTEFISVLVTARTRNETRGSG
jgi:hypothetical protein